MGSDALVNRFGYERRVGRTSTGSRRGDEGALRNHAGSLLSRDTGDCGALELLAGSSEELLVVHTEALRDWVSILTGVVVSIGYCEGVNVLRDFEAGTRSEVLQTQSRAIKANPS